MEAAQHLAPLHQGKLDNLCGLYSILNAVRLACWPTVDLNHSRARQLFAHGVKTLERNGQLRAVLQHGMTERTWARLCHEVLSRLHDVSGIKLEPAFSLSKFKRREFDKALSIIDQHTSRSEPMLVRLLGSYNHYTVITGVTASRLMLFDSFGYRWLSITSCELDGRWQSQRHPIVRRCAMALQKSEEEL